MKEKKYHDFTNKSMKTYILNRWIDAIFNKESILKKIKRSLQCRKQRYPKK